VFFYHEFAVCGQFSRSSTLPKVRNIALNFNVNDKKITTPSSPLWRSSTRFSGEMEEMQQLSILGVRKVGGQKLSTR
jgi:hypothetical protein